MHFKNDLLKMRKKKSPGKKLFPVKSECLKTGVYEWSLTGPEKAAHSSTSYSSKKSGEKATIDTSSISTVTFSKANLPALLLINPEINTVNVPVLNYRNSSHNCMLQFASTSF